MADTWEIKDVHYNCCNRLFWGGLARCKNEIDLCQQSTCPKRVEVSDPDWLHREIGSSASASKQGEKTVEIEMVDEECYATFVRWYKCKSCGCNKVMRSFNYCPGCGGKITIKEK